MQQTDRFRAYDGKWRKTDSLWQFFSLQEYEQIKTLQNFPTGHFRISKNHHFQNEVKWKTFLVITSFICMHIREGRSANTTK